MVPTKSNPRIIGKVESLFNGNIVLPYPFLSTKSINNVFVDESELGMHFVIVGAYDVPIPEDAHGSPIHNIPKRGKLNTLHSTNVSNLLKPKLVAGRLNA